VCTPLPLRTYVLTAHFLLIISVGAVATSTSSRTTSTWRLMHFAVLVLQRWDLSISRQAAPPQKENNSLVKHLLPNASLPVRASKGLLPENSRKLSASSQTTPLEERMSREVQLTYPRLRLFKNCIFTTPSGRAEYSISTNLNRGCCGRTTKIYALCPPTYAIEEEHAIDNEKGASGFNEYIGAPVGGKRGGPIANGKSVVAEINFRPPFRRHLTVEVPNRQRMGTAAVGPMRRNMRDLFIRNANGESVVLDIGGRICECAWIRRNYHVREVRNKI